MKTLKMIKEKILVVYHRIDIDGWLSGAICKMAYPTAELLGYNYGDPIPDLTGYDKIYICDVSLPNMNEKCIWLDHHISAINKYPSSIPGMRSTSFSGCELTYLEIHQDVPTDLILYAGLYDSFRFKGLDYEQEVLYVQYGLRTYIQDVYTAIETIKAFNAGILTIDDLKIQGRIIFNYLTVQAQKSYKEKTEDKYLSENMYENGEYVSTIKRRFICINEERMNFANFGIDYVADGYHGVLSYYFADGVWNYSLYSTVVDCAKIAKDFGGGGHKGAAGFRLEEKL